MPGPPELLRSYFATSVPQLTLLTSTVETSCTWLLLQYLSYITSAHAVQATSLGSKNAHVIFVTLFQSPEFWRENARRIGCRTSDHERSKRLLFVDDEYLNTLAGSGLSKGEPDVSSTPPLSVETLERKVSETIDAMRQSSPYARLHLIIDGLDLLLSSTSVTPEALLDTVYELQGKVDKTVITLSADAPLLHRRETPLEVEHALLLTSLAHQASYVMALRQLSTGAAKDVSGVLRITKGTAEIEPKELLYFVNRDGSTKVFERGSER